MASEGKGNRRLFPVRPGARSAAALLSFVLLGGLAFADPEPGERVLDDFESLEGWTATVAEEGSVEIAHDEGRGGKAMRIDFVLPEHGGWVIVRKEIPLTLPDNYAFHFDVRAKAPAKDFEFKVVDPVDNVWWRRQPDFLFPLEWQTMTVRKARLDFAWGKASGGDPREVAAIELGLRGAGGAGSVWIDNLRFEEREVASRYGRSATVEASTSLPDHEPRNVLDEDPATSWKSGRVAGDQWLVIDFGREREYGGLVIDWDPEDYAAIFQVQVSDDAQSWTTAYGSSAGNGGRDYVYMPDAESRYVRLELRQSSRGEGYGIAGIAVKPFEFSVSPNEFFREMARDSPAGHYPRYFSDRQTHWTVTGVPGDDEQALLSDDGMLEVALGSFSIEPFLYVDGRLVTWNDVRPVPSLEEGYLPIPSVRWEHDGIALRTRAFAEGEAGASTLYAGYRVENQSDEPRHVTLFLAVRPFQVNPPWQSLNVVGGASSIREIRFDGEVIRVNRERRIEAITKPADFGATNFERGSVTDFLVRGSVPPRQRSSDPFGFGSAALRYELDLPPGEGADVSLAIPFHPAAEPDPDDEPRLTEADVDERFRRTADAWRSRLERVVIDLPPEAARLVATLKSNLAYVLINRDGPRIQPGPRTYARSWIRDGVLTSTALLELGFVPEVRAFLDWFADYQFPDGRIPCCVDWRGADPVPENDSNGQFLYGVMEYYRYTTDVGFVAALWPAVVRAVDFIDAQRRLRMTEAFQSGGKRAYFGLLPQSISHEGYSARPVHSYWDDFFALIGLEDAAEMARIVGDGERAERWAGIRDEFRRDLQASIRATMEAHGIDYLPASVELGDFDPSATAIALAPGRELPNLPADALARTFDRYLEDFRARRDPKFEWEAYSPYEIRTAGALLRLGRRQEALDVIEHLLTEQRPAAWNQWPEIVWRDAVAPKFIGDMPHTWVGSGFIQVVRSLLAYERPSDRALVIAAGVPAAWLDGGRHVAVSRLPTHWGVLAYDLRHDGPGRMRLRISGDLRPPPGGIVVLPPLERSLRAASVNGRPVPDLAPDSVTVREVPAEVLIEY